MFLDYRKYIIALFLLLVPLCLYQTFHLKFDFDFEQFFPENDPDLDFFNEFIADFESDDNFLLVAIPHQPNVWDAEFLNSFHSFTVAAKKLPYVKKTQSLTTMDYPVKTPFGINTIPMIHLDNEAKLSTDRKLIMEDQRLVNNLINADENAIVALLKLEDRVGLPESKELMKSVTDLLDTYDFESYHFLGRPFFTDELVSMQQREIMVTTVISGVLIFIILLIIFRKWIGVVISLGSIGLGLLLFMGWMGLMGKEFNIMSALYPVIMLIVGTSDVIHIMSKYVDELKSGKRKREAMEITIKEIGLATLYTSLTTAIGFATLYTSNITPIKQFGINAAVGVLIAYITVIFFTTSVLTLFSRDQIINQKTLKTDFWNRFLHKWYLLTRSHSRAIVLSSIAFLIFCFYGISLVSTNYRIEGNLPKKAKITQDFKYFEEAFSGFRPVEFAITVKKEDTRADSYEVLSEVSKLEDYLINSGDLNSIMSLATLYKSIEKMNNSNQREAYRFPETKRDFIKSKRLVDRIAKEEATVLVSRDKKKTRISTRMNDTGADNIKRIGADIDQWVNTHLDTSLISVKRTGTGLIIDKNAEFIRKDLIQGLFIALFMVSLLMALLFRKARMLIIALIPNLVPVLFAAALLGYMGIELESGVSIIFAVVFGIAVDDTIHFLSKYKLAREKGHDVEKSIEITFMETGKAITFTTIILFFGFLVMMFSQHPPSMTVGILISVTLIGAWICDLFLLPVIMRRFLK